MKDLSPEIKGMDLKSSSRYATSRARITFDVADGNMGRRDMIVEYPLQDDRHLTMLMKEKVQIDGVEVDKEVDLPTTHILSSVIKDVLSKEE